MFGRATASLGRLLRRVRPLPVVAIASVLAAVAAGAVVPLALDGPANRASGLRDPDESALVLDSVDAHGVVDSDLDGLGDALENYVYGTDPRARSSIGGPIPDGWLARHGLDALDPGIADRPAATPPIALLPPAYRGLWPDAFTPSIGEVYAFGRNATWNESRDGPWDSGLDPRAWDGDGDGVADAYLIAHGIDPRRPGIADQRLAGPAGLTVRQAYQLGTDPRRLDTDGDGLGDREEAEGVLLSPAGSRFPPSDPRRFSSSGAGVCDGYLARHGLDPSKPGDAYQDGDRDGATTQEEYAWSRARVGNATCSARAGLDPRAQSSAGLPIPDGWLIGHGLDPLDLTVAAQATQTSASDPGPPLVTPSGRTAPADVVLTVLQEYLHGRPATWNESRDGPWRGGLDPASNDTDGDGLGDAWELRGYFLSATTEPGAPAATTFATTADPTRPDTDGDGLGDGVEARGAGVPANATDARRRDTDFDGLADGEETVTYAGLDPLRADSAGDLLRDGERLGILRARAQAYASNGTYEYAGPPGAPRRVADWLDDMKGAGEALKDGELSLADLAALAGPTGDVDGDGKTNLLDDDMDGDGLRNGFEARPTLYVLAAEGVGPLGARPATDPLNPDTDGDLLLDGWEVRHGALQGAALGMDPSRWDSDADGLDDGKEDPDADGITWYTFTGSAASPTRVANTFPFPNLAEQNAAVDGQGPDPNQASTDGDGLSDGWKVFWGSKYAQATTPKGLFYPGAPGPFQIPAAALAPVPGRTQLAANTTPLVVGAYQRTVTDGATKLAWETLGAAFEGIPDPAAPSGTRTLQGLTGAFPFHLQDAQQAGTNPYMAAVAASTDGDGMPDWWEVLHKQMLPGMEDADCQATATGPSPTRHDAAGDIDDDGLSNVDEFRVGADPLCGDSDMGQLRDADEARFNRSAHNPSDDSALTAEHDTDADGLSDIDELTGLGEVRALYPSRPRTDPARPDTDGDGLLDGATVPDPDDAPEGLAPTHPLAVRFLDLGIAYERVLVAGQPRLFFLGEAGRGAADPRVLDDSGSSLPTGWLVSYGLPVSSGSSAYRTQYEAGRPAWWTEATHGPWWGGLDPTVYPTADQARAAAAQQDPDGDGLVDQDETGPGEDPFPFANPLNAYRFVNFTQNGLPAAPAGAVPQDTSLPAATQRALAQSYLNPREIGPLAASRVPASAPARPVPCLDAALGLAFDAAPGLGPANLTKGLERTLRGRLVSCGTDTGLANVTMEARMGAVGQRQTFGAAFTNATGHFAIPVNITATQQVALPANAVVLRQATGGTVSWTPDPSAVTPGVNRSLFVFAYGSTGLGPFQAKGVPPLKQESFAINNVTVRSGGRIAFTDLPPGLAAATGQSLTVGFRLTDTGGSPLRDLVRVTLGSLSSEVVPASDGTGVASFQLPHSLAGNRTLRAESVPATSGPGAGFTTGGSTQVALRLQRPTLVSLDALPASADAGGPLQVRGRLLAAGAPAVGSPISLSLSGPGAPTVVANGTTDGGGRFAISMPLDAAAPAGVRLLVADALSTDNNSAAQTSAGLAVRSVPQFRDITTAGIRLGAPAQVAGRLVEPDGLTAIPNATVALRLDANTTQAVTDAAGRFNASLPAPGALRPALQVLSFAGDSQHVPVRNETERAAVSATSVQLPSGTLARGAPTRIDLRLVDAASAGVPGAAVTVRWGSEPPQTLVTGPTGVATFTRAANPEEPLGPVTVRATYAGNADGTLGNSTAASEWTVRTLANLSLAGGTFVAGAPLPQSRLTDAGTGTELVGLPIDVVAVGSDGSRHLTNASTDSLGRFALLPDFGANATPVKFVVTARFPGTTNYPAVTATANVSIISATSLAVRPPASMVAQRPTLLVVAVTDARGLPVENGTVLASWSGVDLANASVRAGQARLNLTVPAYVPVGPIEFLLRFPQTPTHAASEARASSTLLAPTHLELEAKPARPGREATVTVTATAGGQPMPYATVFLEVAGAPAGISAVADADGRATFRIAQTNSSLTLAARVLATDSTSPASEAGVLAPLVPASRGDSARWLGGWIAAGVALLACAAALAAARLRRHPLAPALREIVRQLNARGPLEGQVLLAYRTLEDAAIAHGLLDRPANTPRLLQQAVAQSFPPALRPGLDHLVALFEVARYGTARLAPADRDAAVASLGALRSSLRRIDASWPGSSRRGVAA